MNTDINASKRNSWIAWLFAAVTVFSQAMLEASANQAMVELASVYKNENVQDYLVSEKYDGVRAIWKNNRLQTRRGNTINAPEWFTQDLPDVWLDGELWIARNKFEFVASAVSKKVPDDNQWRHIKFKVFDAPNHSDVFSVRASFYKRLIANSNVAHLHAVKQFTVENNLALSLLLDEFTSKGAEGLMLHKASAMFEAGRSNNVLKLKPYMDAEARVIKIVAGKGKFTNVMGALLVETTNPQGHLVQFKIGSGFTDAQRADPPPIGSIVTYKFHGYTRYGTPKFASFLKRR
jgi:DNA ligase-1